VRVIPWWQELPVPDDRTKAALLQNVLATPASTFDPTLPAMFLEEWLWLTLAPVVEVVYPQFVNWDVNFCLDPRSTTVDLGSQLCATGTVRLSDDRNARIVFLVADGARNLAGGPPHWRPTRVSLRDVYIERVEDSKGIDSLDVPALGALRQLLDTPFEQWPTVKFETTITWNPPNPLPGDNVRFNISVRNTGKRSAERVWITIVITPCCADAEVRQEWFPHIPAGQSAGVAGAILLPEGKAIAIVRVRPFQRDKIMRESDPEKESTGALVGSPSHPR
jgi:hypothetical protein